VRRHSAHRWCHRGWRRTIAALGAEQVPVEAADARYASRGRAAGGDGDDCITVPLMPLVVAARAPRLATQADWPIAPAFRRPMVSRLGDAESPKVATARSPCRRAACSSEAGHAPASGPGSRNSSTMAAVQREAAAAERRAVDEGRNIRQKPDCTDELAGCPGGEALGHRHLAGASAGHRCNR
jgi:hypothetical protein